jgi:glycosyltransferase involved in cell wall biosynthesis
MNPIISAIIPTHNNVEVLRRCLASWQKHAAKEPIEIIVVEDGCRDGTQEFLNGLRKTEWGSRALHWYHEDDAHELVCTNRGISLARGSLLLAWQDDMFLTNRLLVPELINTFKSCGDLGLLSLSRGLDCLPCDAPITRWEDLHEARRISSTIGKGPLNWLRAQEVDIVIRPWIVRSACLAVAGILDEAFRPTEWDEADLCFRIRDTGWRVGTYGYERLGWYTHLGSSTLSKSFSESYKDQVLRNGKLFYERWTPQIKSDLGRKRRTWWRRPEPRGWLSTVSAMIRATPNYQRPYTLKTKNPIVGPQ